LQKLTANTQFYQQSPEIITQTMTKLTQLTTDLELAYNRWEELERMVNG
jgi:hypothetical protein